MSDERLDGIGRICQYIGVSRSYFYQKLKPHMEKSGILFTRPGPYGTRQYYPYKRLILAWQIEAKDI